MKKMLSLILFTVLMLSACHSSKLSFSQLENVPQKFEEHIDSDLKLQLIDDDTKGSYIFFNSKGNI